MNRLSIAMGRIGTILLAICLALAILTLIPPASLGTSMRGITYLTPKTYTFVGSSLTLNPQISIRAEFATNNTIKFYIMNLPRENITVETLTGNLTQFKEFMERNADKILLNKTIDSGNVTVEFTPGGIITASFILLNQNPDVANISYKIELLASIAPNVRIIPVISYLSPIGAIFAGQWVFIKFRNRRKES